MKKNPVRIIFVLIILFVLALSVCSTTPQQKTNIIEQATGETVFSFSQDMADKSIMNIPKYINDLRYVNPDKFVFLLALYISKDSRNDFRTVKRAHDWVALNIKYDAQAYFSGSIPYQSYQTALISGRAVCAGYADLFKKICDELNIESKSISGHARGYSYSLFDDESITSNHAWNMVKIYDNWYLVDCTWDSGYLEGNRSVQKYKTDYLFIKPERMIYSHFPIWQTDQLLNPPITKDEYLDMPAYKPQFFKYITEVKPNLGKITKVDGRIKINFYVNNDTNLIIQVLNAYEIETLETKKICRLINYGNKYEAVLTFSEPGDYIVRLFSTEWLADYGMTVTSAYKPTLQETKMQEMGESLKKDMLKFK